MNKFKQMIKAVVAAKKHPAQPPLPRPTTEQVRPTEPFLPQAPEDHDQRQERKGRLPVGSQFRCEYARADVWWGELRVPLPDGDVKIFSTTSSGLFRLEHALDDMYRSWLTSQGPVEQDESAPS